MSSRDGAGAGPAGTVAGSSPVRRGPTLRRWGAAAVVVALVAHAVVLALWPAAHVLLIDLQVYRAGGERVVAGLPLYDGGVVATLLFVYPPFAAVAFAPLAVLSLPVLEVVWTAATLVLLGLVVRAALRAVGVAAPLPWVAAAVVLATWLDPVRTTLYLGQINVVLLALVLLDLLGRADRPWRGVALGLAAAVKLTPLLFVVYLLVTRRFRAAATAVGAFLAASALGFVVAPADSVAYWLQGTFAAADRISPAAATTNHSVSGTVARLLGDGPGPHALYLACAAVLAAVTLALAARAHRAGDELLAVTLCGLCTAAVAPFAWSHHWVWVVPLVVLLGRRAAAGGPGAGERTGTARPAAGAAPAVAARADVGEPGPAARPDDRAAPGAGAGPGPGDAGRRAAAVLLGAVLLGTVAVITALPGPGVGPIPRTGLISLWPDAYLALFVATLAWAAARLRAPATA